MVTTATDYQALVDAMPPGAVTIVNGVEWDEYEDLIRELDGRADVRLSYDNGRLEIMTLSPRHEKPAKLLPHLILVLAQASNLNFLSIGSSTLRKKRKARGTEPDDCYYFTNFKQIADKDEIDLSVDPAPDLAFEVDITNPSLSKFPIYAAIGVPELWRHDGASVSFYRLAGDDYVETDRSDLFPFLTPDALLRFMRIGEVEGVVVMVNEFSEWVKANKK
jgi:Uma2 family endonuclease